MFDSISQANELIILSNTDESLPGKIISITLNLLILALLIIYSVTSIKQAIKNTLKIADTEVLIICGVF